MRIVQYLNRFRLEDGGVVRAVIDLCNALAKHGHEVTALTSDETDVPTEWHRETQGLPRIMHVPIRRSPCPHIPKSQLTSVQDLFESADVVHLHVPWDPVCLHLGKLAKKSSRPYVISIHGMMDEWSMKQKGFKKRSYLALGGRRFLEDASNVHCTASAEADQAHKWFPKGNPVVIPLIFDVEPYRDLPGPEIAQKKFPAIRRDRPMVLFVSRIHPKKAVEKLIDATAILRDSGREVSVIIAGTGEPQYVHVLGERVRENNLDDHVEFIGFVTGIEKVSLYQAADLFVLPTSQENWGFVLVEAMACGTPIITTKGVDIWPELESSGGALIIDASPLEIAESIRTLLNNPDKIDAMGHIARSWVMEHLHVDRVVDHYVKLFQRISAENDF